MTLEEAMKIICDHRAKVKRTKDDWHDGYYDGLTAALMMLSEDEPADTDKPIWEAKDKMTLKELARELRKISMFRYLTVADYKHEGPVTLDCWEYKPTFYDEDCTWRGFHHRGLLYSFEASDLACDLDLSEYADKNGVIDYSRCIVEISDASK